MKRRKMRKEEKEEVATAQMLLDNRYLTRQKLGLDGEVMQLRSSLTNLQSRFRREQAAQTETLRDMETLKTENASLRNVLSVFGEWFCEVGEADKLKDKFRGRQGRVDTAEQTSAGEEEKTGKKGTLKLDFGTPAYFSSLFERHKVRDDQTITTPRVD